MAALSAAERIRGGLLGLAVGDALGAPLEGSSWSAAAAVVAAGLEMTGGGRWAPGEWTDDTALTLALAESIGARGLLDTDDLARRYIDWAHADGKGIGWTTRRALVGARDANDARARARAHYESTLLAAGNGTVMRATPIGLAAPTLEDATDAARRDAELTHGDPAAGTASTALCAGLVAVRHGLDPLASARTQAHDDRRLTKALDLVGAEDDVSLRTLATGDQPGACWTTLAIALHALVAIDDYERGVTWAIALGGDTDTNAAVAGALLGCRHGEQAIPPRWLDRLGDRERIEQAADALLETTAQDDAPSEAL